MSYSAPTLRVSVVAGLALFSCADFKAAAPAVSADASAPIVSSEAGGPEVAVMPTATASLVQMTGLPKVNYRAVHAVEKDRVFIVGDETIVDWDGHDWQVTPLGGVELYGVWANEVLAYAVGTFKNENRGVMMIRGTNGKWVQFAVVEHGLRSVWGTGKFRIAAGNDGAAYFGTEPIPFKNGVQNDRFESAPKTLFSPIITSVSGNSTKHVYMAGGIGGWFGYDGANWKGYLQEVDATRSFRSVFGLPGDEPDVLLGANYYGLWRFRGTRDPVTGERRITEILSEERGDVQRANQYVNGIWSVTPDRFVAVGTAGRVMTYALSELHPQIIPTIAGANDLWGVSGTGFDDVWIVGDAGVILRGKVF